MLRACISWLWRLNRSSFGCFNSNPGGARCGLVPAIAACVACSAPVAQHQSKAGLVLQGMFNGVTHNHPSCHDFLPCCQHPSTALPPAGARQARLKKVFFYKKINVGLGDWWDSISRELVTVDSSVIIQLRVPLFLVHHVLWAKGRVSPGKINIWSLLEDVEKAWKKKID